MPVLDRQDRHAYCEIQEDYYIFVAVNPKKGRFVNAKEAVLIILLFPLDNIIVY